MSMENTKEGAPGSAVENIAAQAAGAADPILEPEAADAPETGAGKADARPAKKQAGIGKLFGGGKKTSKAKIERKGGSEDDIRKLTRTELLELLIDETKEADRLRDENDRLREELAKCHEDLDRIASFEAVIARLEAIVNGR